MATNKYDEIAQAAITLFNRKGYHATSVQDIADEVGLQKGSLYHYINSKEELLLEIATKSINGFCRDLEAVCEQASSAQEKLERAILHHFDIVIGHLEMTTVLLREAFFLSDDQHQLIKDANDRYLNLWVQIIREGVATREFRGEDPRLTALSILGSCNWVYRWYKADGKKSPQEIARYFCDLHLRGILNR
ncbi:TetR/AcrR family transcriptional regulator [Ferroacidibacillus organovorans]|uniref:TetR family transcriptional regulator n=1 Tax=Ferroacidibacillus organovorans TaxID=1765683 RepID=A0A853KCK9_9BACL|nr:TetR/AcrR family transcriptional regulator [Ferroacidibacillus organovorans]KYP79660.1 TetR family transcriptional regulator [Ferroacidibacillus organovorans]OAG94772.1 TetR family transcriptional regulator [Ferroacidibacillus organovorans]